MDKNKIKDLRKLLEIYRKECIEQFPEEQRPATIAEISELSKQVFYLLNSFINVLEDD